MATFYYVEDAQIAQTHTQIPGPYFSIVQESKSVPVSESSNVIKPEQSHDFYH